MAEWWNDDGDGDKIKVKQMQNGGKIDDDGGKMVAKWMVIVEVK